MTAEAANMIPDITFLDDWPRFKVRLLKIPRLRFSSQISSPE